MENSSQTSNSRNLREKLLSYLSIGISIGELILGGLIFAIQWTINGISATEYIFLLMSSLYIFICQFFFVTLCNIAILKPSDENMEKDILVSSLTTLLLYSIGTYFATRIKDIFRTTLDRTRTYNLTTGYLIRITRVLLEFAKATIVILCLKEQGLHYNINVVYTTTTFLYFICTERLFVTFWIYLARLIQLECFDSLEHLYIPIILHIITFCLIIVIIAMVLAQGNRVLFVVISSYFILFLPMKNIIWNYINPLLREKRTFASFKVAESQDLLQWDDICAVCLENMSKARITPCNHLFHPHCLKRCLQTSMSCPLCKKGFLEEN